MAMSLDDLIEHADNVEALLVIKRHQLDHMSLDSVARHRHEETIAALSDRVAELRTAAERLRGDLPTLQLSCVRPGVPPAVGVSLKPETFCDLTATARKIGA